MEKETIIILRYIAVWNWFVLSVILLVGGIILFSFETLFSDIFAISLLVGFTTTLYISYLRRKELSYLNEEE